MTFSPFPHWIATLSINASNCFNRQLVILQGTSCWADRLLKQVKSYPFNEVNAAAREQQKKWYIYSDSTDIKGNVNKQTFKHTLGTESHFVVFYCKALNLDALAALSGTLVSGGILCIVLPEDLLSSSIIQKSYFNQRLVSKIFSHANVEILKQINSDIHDDFDIALKSKSIVNTPNQQLNLTKQPLDMGCLTEEQLTAAKHIIHVVKGHRNRPLVLTADRGRGKSSAIAIACAHLLENANVELNIAITATHRKSLDVFFNQLTKSVKCNTFNRDHENIGNIFRHTNGTVQFIPVDELITHKVPFNLVIADEAASIPLYFLHCLLNKYHRLVFASTVHGYEGAGRSFTLKFKKNIVDKYPESKLLNIQQPIRWAENDPVESFIYDLCLLNAELPSLAELSLPNEPSSFGFNVVNSADLIVNEVLLQQVFAVLVTAHYQTSPNDLQLLLDNKKITLVTLSLQSQIIGVALLIREGESNKNNHTVQKNAALKTLIQANQRRLKDQFIPQSLLTHCGEEHSFDYSYLRVMRIAIVPDLQEQGLGRLFLSKIEAYAQQQKIDFIGASFGVTQQLLNFWQQQEYKIARIGFTKDKASGEHSALVLKAISTKQCEFVDKLEHVFYQSFDYLLAEQYSDLQPELVWQIMTHCPMLSLPLLNESDSKAVEDFYTQKRQYSVCVFHLHKWLQHQMKKPFNKAMAPIIEKVFQRKDVSTLVEKYGFTGKKAFNHYLVQFIDDDNKSRTHFT